MTIKIKDRIYFIYIFAFAIINIGALISMKNQVQTGLLISLISICSLYVLFNGALNSNDIRNGIIFNIYVLVEIISCPMGLISSYGTFLQNHISLLLYGISYILLPQLLFFNLGRNMLNYKIINSLKALLVCNLVLVSVGIYFYIARPQIYLSFVERALADQFAVYGYAPRLVSYLGDSMSIGIICSTSTVLSLFILTNKTRLIFTTIFAVGCIMSMQRGAWISMSLGIIFYIFMTNKINLKKFRINKTLFIVLLISITAIVYLIIKIQHEWASEFEFFDIITRRFNKIGGAADERSAQWFGVIQSATKNLFGSGLGTLSHKGVDFGFPLVCPDGNYMRILGDTGFIGLILFLLLNILSLKNTYKKKEWPIFVIIIIYMIQAIGTNVFDLFYSSFIYWYVLGLSNRKGKILWNQELKLA